MQKILFNSKYGLEQAVLDGRKTMTRRVVSDKLRGKYSDYDDYCTSVGTGGIPIVRYFEKEFYEVQPPLRVGDVVAIAQSYKDVYNSGYPVDSRYDLFRTAYSVGVLEKAKGWNNKMFVRADIMPHHIKITSVKVERLQDISDEDCLREGIIADKMTAFTTSGFKTSVDSFRCEGIDEYFSTARYAFAALIDKISRRGTLEKNPYVFVYEFKLID